MYQLTVNFPTLAELQAFLQGNGGKAAVETTKDPKPVKGTKEAAASAPAAPAAGTSTAATPAAASETKAEPKADPAPAPVPYEKSGLPEKIAAAAKKDRAGIIALLEKFGAKKGAELKPEQFVEFGVAVDKLLAAEESLA